MEGAGAGAEQQLSETGRHMVKLGRHYTLRQQWDETHQTRPRVGVGVVSDPPEGADLL